SGGEPEPEAAPEPEPEPAGETKPAGGKPAQAPSVAPTSAAPSAGKQTVKLPDLGTGDAVDVIEITVAVGDEVAEGDTLMTLEGDKATMDVPSPFSGKITALLVKEGAKVKSGDGVAEMAAEAPAPEAEPDPQPAPAKAAAPDPRPAPAPEAPAPVPARAAEPGKLREE